MSNTVSRGQLAAMLLIIDAFSMFCLTGDISLMTLCGLAAGIAVQFLLTVPAAAYYSSGGTLQSGGKVIEALYLVYFIIYGGMQLAMLREAAGQIYIPFDNLGSIPPSFLITGLIAVVCLYIASNGIRPLARSALIAAALGAVCTAIVCITAFSGGEAAYLTRTVHDTGFADGFVRSFTGSGVAGSLVVLLGFTDSGHLRTAAEYYLAKLVFTAAVTASAVLLAGGIMEIADYPVFTAAQLSQPFSSQRIDSLFLIIFVITAVFSAAVLTACAAHLAGDIFPKFRRFRTVSASAAMALACCFITDVSRYGTANAAATVLMLFAVPCVLLIRKRAGRDNA